MLHGLSMTRTTRNEKRSGRKQGKQQQGKGQGGFEHVCGIHHLPDSCPASKMTARANLHTTRHTLCVFPPSFKVYRVLQTDMYVRTNVREKQINVAMLQCVHVHSTLTHNITSSPLPPPCHHARWSNHYKPRQTTSPDHFEGSLLVSLADTVARSRLLYSTSM